MNYLFRILLYSILLLCCRPAHAVPYTTQLLHFSIKNGFPSNNVYCVLQDHNGYLWFATDNGVVKYNGYYFKIFNTESGLPGNDVWKLFEDSYGRIWLHAYTYEIGYIENDHYSRLPLATSRAVIVPQDIMEKYGVVVFYYNRNKVLPTLVFAGKDFVYEVPVSPLQIWQLTEAGYLYGFMRNDSRIYRFNIFRPGDGAAYIHYVKDLRYKFLYQNRLLNERAKYYVAYDNGASAIGLHNVFTDSTRIAYVSELLGGESDETIYNLADIHNGYRFATNKRVGECSYAFDNIRNDTVSYAVARHAQIAYSIRARNRDDWYTTTTQGIFHHVVIPALFSRLHVPQLPPDVTLIDQGSHGRLYWQDKLTNAVYESDTAGHVVRLFENCGRLFSVMEPAGDSATCFSFTSGIYELNRKKNSYLFLMDRFRHVILNNADFLHSKEKVPEVLTTPVEKSYFKNQRRLLGLGHNTFMSVGLSSVYFFRLQDTGMTVWNINNERYSNLFYDSMYRRCVLYNDNKIALCEPLSMQFSYLTADMLSAVGIQDIEQIKPDGHGNFFIKTGYELFVYTASGGGLRKLSAGVNLSGCKILPYGDHVFIAGPFGIGCMGNAGMGMLTPMRVSANVKSLFYHRLHDIAATGNGDILLSTDNGIYSVPVSSMTDNPQLLQPGGNRLFRLLLSVPYQKNIAGGDTLVIDQGADKLTLNTINYYGNGAVSYAYRVEGLQDDWQQSASGEIILSRLKPGVYWKVICTVKDDVWRSRPVVFYVYHPLYWWQTRLWQILFWIAGIVLFLLILLCVFLLARYSVARTNEKKRLLTDLELRAIHAQINPHFIFNTLSTALYFIHRKEVDKAYTHVNKFSHLLRAYLKSSRNRYVTLAEEIGMIRKYIELQQARFEERFDFNIDVENRIPAANIQIPSLLLQPLVENAITHGLFHKQAKERGLLEIRFYEGSNSNELICEIEDNGVGRIKAAEISRDSIAEERESYGSKLTDELISIFRQYEQMNIDIEYIDKTEPETGTIVKLTIKNIRYVA